jgi:hypothetical protein
MAHSPTSQQLQQVKKEQESTQMRGPVAVPTAKRCCVTMATGALAQDTSHHLTQWTVCIMVGVAHKIFQNNSLSESLCAHMHACVLFMHACRGSKHASASFEQSNDGHGARGQDSPPQRRCALSSSVSHAPRTKDSSKGSKKNSV